MLSFTDNFLNKITMYRLVLYVLTGLLLLAAVFGYFKWLPYGPVSILLSALYITAVCYVTNRIFAWVFGVPTNVESIYITAFILALILTPMTTYADAQFYILAGWASVWAMAGKYIFAIKRKHLFNPAAFAVALTSLTIGYSASWWVGTAILAPFVFVGGFLIVRKLRRADLVLAFFIVAVCAIIVPAMAHSTNYFNLGKQILVNSPLFFFAFIMLTEPLTMPPTRTLRIIYGAMVGFLFAPATHLGSFYFTPELALIAGNVFAYLVSPKYKLMLRLKEKVEVAAGVFDFVFATEGSIRFRPGQYLEWTLGHRWPDSRGNRRYFTIASSPTEDTVRMGVKFYPSGSTYKRHLLALPRGGTVLATGLAGDFVLPKNARKKLVFVAGGIGVTPFRSMIKYLMDKKEERDIVMFYSNRTAADIAYADIFEEARVQLGIKTVYVLTDKETIPEEWPGWLGRIDAAMIAEEVPDYRERTFYLSGPHAMVTGFEETLLSMNVSRTQIKKDYFPGF